MRRYAPAFVAFLATSALLPACTGTDEAAAPASAPAAAGDIAYWTCPMHPSVKAPEAGRCPICGMDLTPVTHAQLTTGEVLVDAERRELYGIRTAKAEMKALARTVRLTGTVGWDLRRQRDVPVRADGTVEGLRVAAGGSVRKGDALFSLRSPELVAAQQDLLATGTSAASGGVDSARLRLRSLGLTDAQIAAVATSGRVLDTVPILAPAAGVVTSLDVVEGSWVSAGTSPARIADAGSVWIEATVAEADASALAGGGVATVSLPSLPGRTFTGSVHPIVTSASPISRVRVSVQNADGALRPGLVAVAEVAAALGTAIVVPADAVVYSGTRRVVFVDAGDGRLQPREVVPGARVGDEIAIVSGILPGETVVAGGNFLVAADSRLRSPAAWGPHAGHSEHAGAETTPEPSAPPAGEATP